MRCTGASISGGELVLVTVVRREAEFTIENHASLKLKLEDSADQGAVRAFFTAVDGFVRSNKIARIAVRGRQARGDYAGGPLSFKIEGFLQILESCSTTIIMPQTIASLVRKYGLTLPPNAFKYQEDAFLTACSALVV